MKWNGWPRVFCRFQTKPCHDLDLGSSQPPEQIRNVLCLLECYCLTGLPVNLRIRLLTLSSEEMQVTFTESADHLVNITPLSLTRKHRFNAMPTCHEHLDDRSNNFIRPKTPSDLKAHVGNRKNCSASDVSPTSLLRNEVSVLTCFAPLNQSIQNFF